MATIEKYATAAGLTRYRVRYRTPDRKQTDKRGFTTKRAATEFATTVEGSKLRGEYIAPAAGKVFVGDLVRAWRAGRADLSASTAERYDGIIREHVAPRWDAVALSDVLHSDVQGWVTSLTAGGMAPASVRKVHRVLSMTLALAVRDRRLVANPAAGVKIARPQVTARRYLSHQQVAAFADAAGDNGRPVILLLAYCGLRWGEMAALKVRNVDLMRRRLTVDESVTEVSGKLVWGGTKNHQRRSVPIPRFLVPLLTDALAGRGADDLAFTTASRGSVMRYRTARRGWFDGAVVEAGLPEGFHPHELRHTAASLAISAGANVKAVQRMLGHSSAAMTLDTYADLFPDDLDDVAERLDQAASLASVGKVWARGTAEAVLPLRKTASDLQ